MSSVKQVIDGILHVGTSLISKLQQVHRRETGLRCRRTRLSKVLRMWDVKGTDLKPLEHWDSTGCLPDCGHSCQPQGEVKKMHGSSSLKGNCWYVSLLLGSAHFILLKLQSCRSVRPANSTLPTQAHSNRTVALLQLHWAPSLSELIAAIVQPQIITKHKKHFWSYTEFLALFYKWHFLTPSTGEKNISFAAECGAVITG